LDAVYARRFPAKRRFGGNGWPFIVRQLLLIRFVGQAARHDSPLQNISESGGVGERLKPAVLKNEIADSLSDRKFNQIPLPAARQRQFLFFGFAPLLLDLLHF